MPGVINAEKQHFEPPSYDQDLGRMSKQEIDDMIEFTNFANHCYAYAQRNGLPYWYTDEQAKVRNQRMLKSNVGPINLEELYALDSSVAKTTWQVDTFAKIGVPSYIQTNPRWADKQYIVTGEGDPRFTKSFENPSFIRITHDKQFVNGVGLYQGISMSFAEIRESGGGLWGPEAMMRRELAAKMGRQKSRRGFLGTSILNAQADDGSDAADWGITGIVNDANIQAHVGGAGGDANMADAGDVEYTVKVAMTDLKNCLAPGKIVILSTGGIAAEMYDNRQTYLDTLDVKRVKEILKIVSGGHQNNQWGGWYVTEQLYAGTPANTAQVFVIMKVGPSYMSRQVVYPDQMLPSLDKQYKADLKEVMITGDIIKVNIQDSTNNAYPITVEDGITTTGTGWIPEGTRIF